MKGLLEEIPIDLILTDDEWDHVQYLIGEELDCINSGIDLSSPQYRQYRPFIASFKKIVRDKLLNAGFKKDNIDNQDLFEPVFKGLGDQGIKGHGWARNNGLPYGCPANAIIFNKDKTVYWIKPDIEAALRALQLIHAIKPLLVNNDAVKIYLLTLAMACNLFRSGRAPELARVEAEKRDKSKWTHEVKKMIIRRAVERVFKKNPSMQKTLGFLWNKFDVVNRNQPFIVINKHTGHEHRYTVQTGKDEKEKDVVFITEDSTEKPLPYKKRSLQRFIDELK